MRNVQLAILSVPMGLITSYLKDGAKIADNGFFHGYDNFVWFTVAQNALGGLLVAVVVKYADNILKVNTQFTLEDKCSRHFLSEEVNIK